MTFIFNFLQSIIGIVEISLYLYIMIIICRSVISFFDHDPYHYMVRFFAVLTEPLLKPIRRAIPSFYAGYDLSPIILIVSILLVRYLILEKLLKGLLFTYMGDF